MATAAEGEEAGSRRKSGRVVRKPELFADEEHSNSILMSASNKRKRNRATNGSADFAELEDDAQDSEDDEDDEEDEDSNDEVTGRGKKQRKAALLGKPAAKRSRTTNGASTTLAIRSATGPRKAVSKAAKARSRPSALGAGGLYAVVFGQGNTPEDAAGEWLELLQKDNVGGIRDLINFILESIGCNSRIENSDVEDIDHVPDKLGDILEEYAHQPSTDYALSRTKQTEGFKTALHEFFNAIIHALHNSGALYDQLEIYDNIHIWSATMAGASYRPFRHVATIVSLSMTTALCQIAQELQNSMATTKTQIEAEKKKKKGTNKARVIQLEEDTKRDESRLSSIDSLLRDSFDTVYVHRYRDVDERIRVQCVTALGNWILLYRKMFLEGQFLRYLGWVLSDPNPSTRLEVVRALKGLFKHRSNVGALRAFTDRFRPRIVEMGARDTDTGVRVEAIELLDRLRNAELLEPEDIDTIGGLIFDDELRVRRAVAKFFVSNIEDLYKASVEDLDEEQYAATLPAVNDADDFMEPCQSWIKFKCLAQTLAAHDHESSSRKESERGQDVFGTEGTETRFMLATQSIFPYMPDLQHWEALAGYLLYDHSSISAKPKQSNVNAVIRAAYKLESNEDTVLLDVLQYGVKLYLQQIIESQTDSKGKRTNAGKDEARKKQEAAANHLIAIIPQLLSKFGSVPEAAASILRLEQLLNIDLINDLQTGEGSYVQILEDINKQFTTHNDRKVLIEASKAFRAARSYESSQDAVDAKVLEIWTESKETLSGLLAGKNVSGRGTVDRATLRGIGDVLGRLAQLAAVSDCTEALEGRLASGGGRKSKGRASSQDTLLETLIELAKRGPLDKDITEQVAELEDRIYRHVLTVCSFYFRWKIVNLKTAIEKKDTKTLSASTTTRLVLQRNEFIEAVYPVILSRPPLDPLRVMSVLHILDLFTLFATIRHMQPNKGSLTEEVQANLASLTASTPKELLSLIMETHEKMEKRLSKKTKKRIELPLEEKKKLKSRRQADDEGNEDEQSQKDIEKPPEDSEDEAENASDSEDDGDVSDDETPTTGAKGREARKQAALVAEQALCELASKLVLASIANVINQDGKVKARLQVNRTRLGKSYGQVVAYLDEKKTKSKEKSGAKDDTATAQPANNTAKTPAKSKSAAQRLLSEPMVLEDDDIEDDEELEAVEEGDVEDLRRRGLEDDEIADPEDDEHGDDAQQRDEDDDMMGD